MFDLSFSNPLLKKIFASILIVIATYFISRLSKKILFSIPDRSEKIDETFIPILSTVVRVAIYLLGVIILLEQLGINTNGLVALLGATGLTIGLALKDTLQNIAAGIMFLILRPFKVGDGVECGGKSGTIERIGLFTTILKTFDGIFISLPNSSIWGSPITNFNRNSSRRMDFVIGVDYSTSMDHVFDLFKKITEAEKRFLQDPAPQIMLKAFGDSSLNVQIRAWTSTEDYWSTWWDLHKTVRDKLSDENIEIPFPQTVVQHKNLFPTQN